MAGLSDAQVYFLRIGLAVFIVTLWCLVTSGDVQDDDIYSEDEA